MPNANSDVNQLADQAADIGRAQVISETQVKQARKGTHTFAVLVASLALAVILVFGLWAYKASDLKAAAHADSASKAAAASAFNAGPSQPKSGSSDSKNPT